MEEVIDFHVHVLSPDMIRDVGSIFPRDPYFALLCQGPDKALATADEAISEMDASGVSTSVVFGYAFKDMGLCRMANDYIVESVRRYPGRLRGFGCVPPRHPQMEAEVVRCREEGLEGIGELFPDGQDFDLSDVSHTRSLAGIIKETGMCLFLHTNEGVGHLYPGKGGTGPEKAWSFASKHPELRLVLAHWGGGLAFYELMPEVRRALENVFYDTAADPFLYDKHIYRVAREAAILHKVLLGTDFPLISPSRYLGRLEASGLTREETRMVTAQNAHRALGDVGRMV